MCKEQDVKPSLHENGQDEILIPGGILFLQVASRTVALLPEEFGVLKRALLV